jgi:hypothetical protein
VHLKAPPQCGTAEILMLAVDGMQSGRLIESNEVVELVFLDICGQRVYLLQ